MGSDFPPLKRSPDLSLNLTLSSCPSLQTLKPEERGIRLIQLLLTCATHVSSGNLHLADACLHQISHLSSITGDSMQRLASRFASALAVRLIKRWSGIHKALNPSHEVEPDRTGFMFPRTFPYLDFAYDIINRTLIRTMANEQITHIIHLGSAEPNLWTPLLRAFSKAPRGSPYLKITCVNSDQHVLEKLRRKLVKEAEALDVPFQFQPLDVDIRDVNIEMFKVRSGEALAITSILNLHILLGDDDDNADQVDPHFGVRKIDGVHESKAMNRFLSIVRSMWPKVFLLVEQESEQNMGSLRDRFIEGLFYYSAVFDSVEAHCGTQLDRLEVEDMFGKQIENIVACEGTERVERYEKHVKWMVRLGRVGFKPVRLWFDPIETENGYKVVNERGCFMICWHERPLYTVSVWCP